MKIQIPITNTLSAQMFIKFYEQDIDNKIFTRSNGKKVFYSHIRETLIIWYNSIKDIIDKIVTINNNGNLIRERKYYTKLHNARIENLQESSLSFNCYDHKNNLVISGYIDYYNKGE